MTCFCLCVGFALWYDDDGFTVCTCGHPADQHLDGNGSCVGDVVVS